MDRAYLASVAAAFRDNGIVVERGLSDTEISITESRFGFAFPAETHRPVASNYEKENPLYGQQRRGFRHPTPHNFLLRIKSIIVSSR